MELRVGGGVTLRFLHNQLSSVDEPTPEPFRAYENGVTTQGVITRCEPPRAGLHLGRLARAAVGSPVRTEGPRQGTLLTLTHRKLADRAAMVDVAQAGMPICACCRPGWKAASTARSGPPWKRCRKTTKPTFRAPDAGASPARRPVSRRRLAPAPHPLADAGASPKRVVQYYRGYQPDKTG